MPTSYTILCNEKGLLVFVNEPLCYIQDGVCLSQVDGKHLWAQISVIYILWICFAPCKTKCIQFLVLQGCKIYMTGFCAHKHALSLKLIFWAELINIGNQICYLSRGFYSSDLPYFVALVLSWFICNKSIAVKDHKK